jgi:hypothetical protein
MDRASAYATLTAELERWSHKSLAELVASIGAAPVIREVDLGGERVSIEVAVTWASASRESIAIEATANGPSHWLTQRLVERIIVPKRASGATSQVRT